MPRDFAPPDFSAGDVELRHEEGEVCIYATIEGLKRLSEFCASLMEKPRIGHIHLEDHMAMTADSLPGVVAVFDGDRQDN